MKSVSIIFVAGSPFPYILKTLRRKYEIAFLRHDAVLALDGDAVLLGGIVVVGIAIILLALVDVGPEIFRNEPVKEESKHIALEVPTVHASAELVCNCPDGTMKLLPLLFFISHIVDCIVVSNFTKIPPVCDNSCQLGNKMNF